MQAEGDSASCGMDVSSPLCSAKDGSGSAGGAGSAGGGCVLDGIGTDCTFVNALALAGGLTMSARDRVAAGTTIAQDALQTSPCAGLFNPSFMGGATVWSVLQNNVKITYSPESDSDTFASTSVSNGITTIDFNTAAGSVFHERKLYFCSRHHYS